MKKEFLEKGLDMVKSWLENHERVIDSDIDEAFYNENYNFEEIVEYLHENNIYSEYDYKKDENVYYIKKDEE